MHSWGLPLLCTALAGARVTENEGFKNAKGSDGAAICVRLSIKIPLIGAKEELVWKSKGKRRMKCSDVGVVCLICISLDL